MSSKARDRDPAMSPAAQPRILAEMVASLRAWGVPERDIEAMFEPREPPEVVPRLPAQPPRSDGAWKGTTLFEGNIVTGELLKPEEGE
jgi:hypothetical protein